MAIPPGSLKAEYDFQNGSYPGTGNTVFDLSGTGNTLAITSGGTWVSGTPNYFDLNGNTAIYNSPAVGGIASTNVYTLNTWYYLPSSINDSVIFEVGRDVANQAAQIGSGFGLGTLYGTGGFGLGVVEFTGAAQPGWNFLSYVSTGSSTTAYLNGASVGSTTNVPSLPSNAGIVIGTALNSANPPVPRMDLAALGRIGYASVYNVALAPGDITSIYDNTKNNYIFPLIEYDFSDPACYSGTGNTVYDLSGNAIDGAISGATYVADGQKSYFLFNGTSGSPDSIISESFTNSSPKTWTMQGWFYPTGIGQDNFSTALGAGTAQNSTNGGTPTIDWSWVNANDWSSTTGADKASIRPNLNWTPSEWYFVSNTWDGTTSKLYVNGSLVGSTTIPSAVTMLGSSTPLTIGKYPIAGTSSEFQGRIGYVQYYRGTALGSTEILDAYNTTRSRFLNPIAEWDFSTTNYDGGLTANDISGNNNNGTFNQTPSNWNQTFGYIELTPTQQVKIPNANYPNNLPVGTAAKSMVYWGTIPNYQTTAFNFGGTGSYGSRIDLGVSFSNTTFGIDFANTGRDSASYNPGVDTFFQAVVTTEANGTIADSIVYINGIARAMTNYSVGTGDTINITGPNAFYGLNWEVIPGNIKVLNARIYDYVLTPAEVAQDYTNFLTRLTPPDLIAQYDFSDPTCYSGTGNTVYDLSGLGNNLTLTNSPALTGTGTSKTLQLLRDSAQTARKSTALNGITDIPMTFNIWSKMNPATTSEALMSYGVIGDSTIPGIWGKFFNDFISFEGGFGNPTISSGITVNPVDFYNIIVSINPSTATLYVNGTGVGTSSHTINLPAGSQFSLSGLFGDSNLYSINAEIGLVEVYNVALGSTDVTNLYNSQVNRFAPAPPAPSNGVGGRQFAQGFNG